MSLGSSYAISYAYSNNRLSSISGTRSLSYGYDVYGNVTSAGTATYQFDDASNLRTCTNCTSAGAISHRYDGSNTRVTTTRSGVTTYEFWSANGHLLAEFTPTQDNRLVEYFYLAGRRVAQREPSSSSSPPPGLIATTTLITAAPNPATVSQQVTMTATVAPASGAAPTGTVDLYENGVVVDSRALSGSPAQATFQRSYATPGSRSLHAAYRGSTTHAGSSSSPVTLQVSEAPQPPPGSLTLTAAPATATVGTPITFKAQFSGGSSPFLLGQGVSFKEGSATGAHIGSATIEGAMTATLVHSFKTAGPRTVYAVYTGPYPAATSNGVAILVNAPTGPPTGTLRQAVLELLEE
jgi:hypothetical protein